VLEFSLRTTGLPCRPASSYPWPAWKSRRKEKGKKRQSRRAASSPGDRRLDARRKRKQKGKKRKEGRHCQRVSYLSCCARGSSLMTATITAIVEGGHRFAFRS